MPGYPTQQRQPAYDARGHISEARSPHEDQNSMTTCRRRGGGSGVLTIAGVFALAVIGTAGAFGYRALFGGSGTHRARRR